uniref:Ovule protein n=1 Tax=Parascaris univalens TaxID=6257 RepID=A0A914ZMH2_PARUN
MLGHKFMKPVKIMMERVQLLDGCRNITHTLCIFVLPQKIPNYKGRFIYSIFYQLSCHLLVYVVSTG